MTRMHFGAIFVLIVLFACTEEEPVAVGDGRRLGDSTFEKFLVRAEQGDADAQNLVGFMLFFGEGIAVDKVEAHYWYHRAAGQGHAVAQMNLAVMHSVGRDALADPAEAKFFYERVKIQRAVPKSGVGVSELPTTLEAAMEEVRGLGSGRPEPGRANYEKFCAGCHGLNGVARYVVSPSFAIGERMDKSDERLLESIANGLGIMPSWKEKLGEGERRDILAYVRTLEDRFRSGVVMALRDAPASYYTFGPMSGRPFAPGAEILDDPQRAGQ